MRRQWCRRFRTATAGFGRPWRLYLGDGDGCAPGPETGERHLDLLKWGLLPSWAKDPAKAQRPINARAETIATSGLFRGAFKARRCIVPADAFYEWQAGAGGKQSFAIARQDGQPMAFAGLWEGFRWPDDTITRAFTIAATSANADVAGLHDRMPMILEAEDRPAWLGAAEGDPAALPDAVIRVAA
jgi:putative SOS response-associated peptidase YedK